MAHLLDLPDELLDMIVNYCLLRVDEEERLWSPWLTIPRPSHINIELGKDLNRLVRTSKPFHNLYQGLLYTDVALYDGELQLSKFLNTVEKTPALAERTKSFFTFSPKLKDTIRLFHLPNLTALEIIHFREWLPSVPDPRQYHTSPVRHLYLPSCSAVEARLTEILAFPAVLKSLEYEYEFHEYDLLHQDNVHESWTSENFMRALSSQRTTLERLTFTRSKKVAAEFLIEPAIDLSTYTALRFLSVTWAILQVDRREAVHNRMPPLLEHLQVLYDEGSDDNWGVLDEDWAWLESLLQNKAPLPALRKIDVFSTEVPRVEDDPDLDDIEYFTQGPGRGTATAAQLEAAKAWRLRRLGGCEGLEAAGGSDEHSCGCRR